MFYYFTTTSEKFTNSFANSKTALHVKGVNSDSVDIEWPKILTMDQNKNVAEAKANYTVFLTDNIFDYNHMESICYLSKMKQNIHQL